jgi:predicted MFS family arabinose efflux permease
VPLIALGAAGLVLAGICLFILPAGRSEKNKAASLSFPASAAALLRIPSFLVIAGAGVLTAIGTWIFINWLPLYFRENMGMTLASAGFFGSSLVSLSGAAGQVVGGVASDRVARGGPHRRMWLQAVLILCAAPMLLAFVLTRSLTLIMAALVAYSVLRTSADLNMLPLLCDLAGVDKRSTAFGFTNMVNTLAGGLGVFVAGYLKSGFGLDGVFAGVAGILALDAVLLFAGYYFLLRKDLRASSAIV